MVWLKRRRDADKVRGIGGQFVKKPKEPKGETPAPDAEPRASGESVTPPDARGASIPPAPAPDVEQHETEASPIPVHAATHRHNPRRGGDVDPLDGPLFIGADEEDVPSTSAEKEERIQAYHARREADKKSHQHYNPFFNPPDGLLKMSRIPSGLLVPMLGALVMQASVKTGGKVSLLDVLLENMLSLSIAVDGKARDAFQKLVVQSARRENPEDMGTEQ